MFSQGKYFLDPLNLKYGYALYNKYCIMKFQAMEYNGRSHWGKTGFYYHSREMLERKLDPGARQAFLRKMQEFDPKGLFMNSFGRRLTGQGNEMDIDSAVKHCALLDHCVCAKHGDCADGQRCARIAGYPNYPVCRPRPKQLRANRLHPQPLSSHGIMDYFLHLSHIL